MAGLEKPLKGLRDSHIQNQQAPADPEEKKTRTLPGRLDQCHATLAGNIPCIPKGYHTITANNLLTEPIQNHTCGQRKAGFS